MKLFNVENGVRADIDIFNIDLYDEYICQLTKKEKLDKIRKKGEYFGLFL